MSEREPSRRKRPTPDLNGATALTALGPRWTCGRCGRRQRTQHGLPPGWSNTRYAAGGLAVYCGACDEAMRAFGRDAA